ncbi:MAG: mannose-6-phosphate isomerase, class I, partial [Bacteroidetes bacterium]
TDFWLLHGFRREKEIDGLLDRIPEFERLKAIFQPGHNLANLYRHVMEMPQEKVNEILTPLYNRLENENRESAFKRDNPDFWALRAFKDFTEGSNLDRGVFSVYLLNLVNVKPGEIIYQGSGILHAYLEGVNMELMANSDNVLRGGLTPKHVDVPELMKHVTFESVIPQILKPVKSNAVRSIVETPAPDFQLSHLLIKSGQQYEREAGMGPEIYFVFEGEVEVDGEFRFSKGEAFFIPDFAQVEMRGEGELFCAGVPF